MIKQKQEILNDNGFTHIKVIDENNVHCTVDGEDTVFNRGDVYSGHPLSGWANFGSVGGDHRMISAIAEDITEAFELIK